MIYPVPAGYGFTIPFVSESYYNQLLSGNGFGVKTNPDGALCQYPCSIENESKKYIALGHARIRSLRHAELVRALADDDQEDISTFLGFRPPSAQLLQHVISRTYMWVTLR